MKRLLKILINTILLISILQSSFASGHFEFRVIENKVYCVVYFQEKHFKIADAKTFTLVGNLESKYGRMDRFAKDRYYVYDGCQRMKGISPQNFDTLDGGWDFVRANNQVYYTNGNHKKWIPLKGLSPHNTTFENVVLPNNAYSSGRIIKDKNTVFYQHAANRNPIIVPKADPATFKILNQYYAKDQNRIYYLYQESFEERFIPLEKADIESFQLSEESHRQHIASDKNWRYRYTITTHEIEITSLDAPINYAR